MIGVDKMTNKKRVGIVLNSSIYEKLQSVAGRYGMTVNSLMAYILGQWADNFDVREKMTERVMEEVKQLMAEVAESEVNKLK